MTPCKTLTKYAKSTSPSRQSRLDPKLSLAVKQRPTLYLYSSWLHLAVEGVVAALQKGKGVDPDGVSSKILQAGGSAAAVKLAEIHQGVIQKASWPFSWTGGRIHDTYKHKRNPAECDNSRRILLMSHCGKPLCKMLAAAISPQYNSAIPDTQFGATAQRGADFATHILVTFMEVCRKRKKSFFVWSKHLTESHASWCSQSD